MARAPRHHQHRGWGACFCARALPVLRFRLRFLRRQPAQMAFGAHRYRHVIRTKGPHRKTLDLDGRAAINGQGYPQVRRNRNSPCGHPQCHTASAGIPRANRRRAKIRAPQIFEANAGPNAWANFLAPKMLVSLILPSPVLSAPSTSKPWIQESGDALLTQIQYFRYPHLGTRPQRHSRQPQCLHLDCGYSIGSGDAVETIVPRA